MSKLTESVSAVAPLRAALDGTPVKRPRAPGRLKVEAPVVETSVICLCGERFADHRETHMHVRRGDCPSLERVLPRDSEEYRAAAIAAYRRVEEDMSQPPYWREICTLMRQMHEDDVFTQWRAEAGE